MTKKYKIHNIDCANCALQLEDKINKAQIVDKVSINFMMEKITIEDNDITTEKLDAIQEICAKFEDGVEIQYKK